MVGYLKPNFKGAPKEYKKEYKSFYCGLCKALKRQYGYLGVLSLNYEVTAFLILLSGLREKNNSVFHGSCTISPFVPVSYIDYFQDDLMCAANLSILITNYEVKDNLNDDGSLKWQIANRLLSKKVNKSITFFQNDFLEINNAVDLYYKSEKDNSSKFQDVLECEGNLIESFISVLIKNYDENTTSLLLKLSNIIGKWIYLIDACDDLEDDIKNGNFNPLLLMDSLNDIKIIIQTAESEISEIIKNLPIVNYKKLIDYIFMYNLKSVRRDILQKVLFGDFLDLVQH